MLPTYPISHSSLPIGDVQPFLWFLSRDFLFPCGPCAFPLVCPLALHVLPPAVARLFPSICQPPIASSSFSTVHRVSVDVQAVFYDSLAEDLPRHGELLQVQDRPRDRYTHSPGTSGHHRDGTSSHDKKANRHQCQARSRNTSQVSLRGKEAIQTDMRGTGY